MPEQFLDKAQTRSPAFHDPGDGGQPAQELKFLLDVDQAVEVQHLARALLQPDPNGDRALRGAYLTTSVYLDTAGRIHGAV
jgi:hypothetical protein